MSKETENIHAGRGTTGSEIASHQQNNQRQGNDVGAGLRRGNEELIQHHSEIAAQLQPKPAGSRVAGELPALADWKKTKIGATDAARMADPVRNPEFFKDHNWHRQVD